MLTHLNFFLVAWFEEKINKDDLNTFIAERIPTDNKTDKASRNSMIKTLFLIC